MKPSNKQGSQAARSGVCDLRARPADRRRGPGRSNERGSVCSPGRRTRSWAYCTPPKRIFTYRLMLEAIPDDQVHTRRRGGSPQPRKTRRCADWRSPQGGRPERRRSRPTASSTRRRQTPPRTSRALDRARSTLPTDRVDSHAWRLTDPLPDGPFDVVFSALTIHHLDGAGKAGLFRRGGGVLSPSGRLVIRDFVVPGDPSDVVTPIDDGYDKPSGVAEQLRWLDASGPASLGHIATSPSASARHRPDRRRRKTRRALGSRGANTATGTREAPRSEAPARAPAMTSVLLPTWWRERATCWRARPQGTRLGRVGSGAAVVWAMGSRSSPLAAPTARRGALRSP
jgi:Methyltransferase domain